MRLGIPGRDRSVRSDMDNVTTGGVYVEHVNGNSVLQHGRYTPAEAFKVIDGYRQGGWDFAKIAHPACACGTCQGKP